MRIYTVGHSTRTIDAFVGLLTAYGIEALADIRSWPSSKRFPHFGREALEEQLREGGIEYYWLKKLGGKRKRTRDDSPNTGWRDQMFSNYADYMDTDQFRAGLEALLALAREKTTTVMCAEGLYLHCHRQILADNLESLGVEVVHIREEGESQRHRYTPFLVIDGDRLTYPKVEEGGQLDLF